MTNPPATRREARLAAPPSPALDLDDPPAATSFVPQPDDTVLLAALLAEPLPMDATGGWVGPIESATAEAVPAPQPVFVDPSGRRSRRVRTVVAAAVGGALIYIAFLIVAVIAQPGVDSPLLPLLPAPAAGPVEHAPVGRSPSPPAATPSQDPTAGTRPSPAATTTSGAHPVAPSPSVAPSPAPSPSVTAAPGRSGDTPKHRPTPQPKPTRKP